ncbi:hypothetical protein IQ256_10675 [cf. Phormidesmis sp. LEGE 11477]|nr:hypothetical protein [cf. Phormidesmis sp. LEGE 11477]
MSYRSSSKKSQKTWIRTAFIVMLAALLYGLQEIDQSSLANAEVDLSEVDLVGFGEANLPQFLFNVSEAISD